MNKTIATRATLTAALVFAAALASCATARGGDGLTLTAAIERTADEMVEDLQPGTRVAIVAFESEAENLSDFIMEELTAALFRRGIEIADRRNLPFVFQELEFQMSDAVSDDTAQSVGQFLGAQLVITGDLWDLGAVRRLAANAIRVETAVRASVPRHDVRNDRALQSMIASLQARPMPAAGAPRPAAIEQARQQTAGTFLDSGIMHASRGEFEPAIRDLTEALRLDPDMAAAYRLLGRALYASAVIVMEIADGFTDVGTLSIGGQATADQARVLNMAVENFDRAIELEPNSGTYVERGRAHSALGNFDRALADFDHAIQLNPNHVAAFSMRGSAHRYMGNLDLAIADHNQAIHINPNHAGALTNRGNVHRAMGNLDLAIADFEAALRINPNSAVVRRNLENVRQSRAQGR